MWWWWGHNQTPNFGDAINPYLVSKLGDNVVPTYVSSFRRMDCLKRVVSNLLHFRKLDVGRWRKVIRGNRYALCIGSILENSKPGNTVWGSGFMTYDQSIQGGKILAVRGYESLKRLKELGYNIECAIGDPAILLPLVYTPNVKCINEIGIIPHIKEYEYIKSQTDLLTIDFRTSDIESVIDKICSCKLIFSTSLHGLIVAHAYGIPALWMHVGNIGTDGFKFHDYFSSVGIPNYEPLSLKDALGKLDNVGEYRKYSLPTHDINTLHRDLLRCTPFPLKSQFCTFN